MATYLKVNHMIAKIVSLHVTVGHVTDKAKPDMIEYIQFLKV